MKAPKMKKLGLATVAASGLAAAILGLAAPAAAAPSGPGSAQDTINHLKADGYNVIVNRVGGTPPPPLPTRRSTSTSSNANHGARGTQSGAPSSCVVSSP